jgi:tetratricopeptide (TPR) repeat protein
MAHRQSRTIETPPGFERSENARHPLSSVVGGLSLAPSLALALAMVAAPASAPAGVSTVSPRSGAPGMLEPHTGSLLVTYYEVFLREQDIEHFRRSVSTRYTEGSLCRLIESGDTQSRRAALLALGLYGTYQCNASVARALRDDDLTVRRMASDALWAIWFRADTDENNKTLEQVSKLIGRQRTEEALDLATQLIARAPKFAEAYNQRAYAHFLLGHFEESVADCRRVLELNPYHFGALAGMAKCQLQLEQPGEALKTLRRALKLEPHNESLRGLVSALETDAE